MLENGKITICVKDDAAPKGGGPWIRMGFPTRVDFVLMEVEETKALITALMKAVQAATN